MIIACESCGRTFEVDRKPDVLLCCGSPSSFVETAAHRIVRVRNTSEVCQHVGELVAKADGSCSGKRDVFQCQLFNEPCWLVGCWKPWPSIVCDPPLPREPRNCSMCGLNSARGPAIAADTEWWHPAVTSLSPRDDDGRQWLALNSWRHLGLSIVAVQTAEEIRLLSSRYPQVHKWIACDDNGTEYLRPTQRINRLADVALELDRPIMLINSDIEIYTDPDELSLLYHRDQVTVGIRHNYHSSIYDATREPWGLDAFILHPHHARSLPLLPFSIGKPVWDYWLPAHFKSINVPMQFIGKRMFFHRSHDLQWTQAEWDMAASWLTDRYDFDPGKCIEYRSQFPFGPQRVPSEALSGGSAGVGGAENRATPPRRPLG